jgi:L-fuconolactonase
VFVQCECDFAQYREEVAWVTQLARQDPRLQGIVAWAPLEKGENARPELEALAKNKLVKGIRRISQFEPDGNFGRLPNFVRGGQLLADYHLSFDLCLKGNEQFRNTIQLVRQSPQVNFILDHIGKPFIKERVREPWQTYLKELAALPNTWCKLSGLVTEADFQLWTKDDLTPYIAAVIEAFGWDRVMFGGDWPVVVQAATYPRWIETLEWAVAGATPAQLKKLFHDNAIAFYRLPV